MGCDAVIFAKNHKKYYYFDRLYNLDCHAQMLGIGDDKYDEIYSKLFFDHSAPNMRGEVNQEELTYLCERNAEFWRTQPERDRGRAGWNEGIIEFVKAHPNDVYFVGDDHSSPSWWDIEKEFGYEFWKTPEEIAYEAEAKLMSTTCICIGPSSRGCQVHNRVTRANVEELIKALSASTVPENLKHGSVLKVESMEDVLKGS